MYEFKNLNGNLCFSKFAHCLEYNLMEKSSIFSIKRILTENN